jgi:uridine kinase
VGVLWVRWEKVCTVSAGDYNSSMEKEKKIIISEDDFINDRRESTVKRVDFVSDRVSYIDLKVAGVI